MREGNLRKWGHALGTLCAVGMICSQLKDLHAVLATGPRTQNVRVKLLPRGAESWTYPVRVDGAVNIPTRGFAVVRFT